MAESKQQRQTMVSEKALAGKYWQDEKRIIHITQIMNDIFDALKNRSGLISSHYDVIVPVTNQKGPISLPAHFKNVTDNTIRLLENFKKVSYDDVVQKGHEALSKQDQEMLDQLIEQIIEVKRLAHNLEPFSSELTSRCRMTLLACFDTLNWYLNEIKHELREAILRAEDIKKVKQLEISLGKLNTELAIERESKVQAISSAEEKSRTLEESVQRYAALEKINQQLIESEAKAREQAAQTSGTIQAQQLTIDQLRAENARLKAQPAREQKSGDKESEVKALQTEFEEVKAQFAHLKSDTGNRQDKVEQATASLQGLQVSPVTRLVVGEGLGLGTIATGVALGLGLLASGPVGWFTAGIVIGIGAAICIWSVYEAWKDYRLAKEIENIPFRVGDTDSGTLAQSVGQMMRRMPDLKNKQPEQQPVPTPRVVNDAAPAVPPSVQNAAATSQKVGKKR